MNHLQDYLNHHNVAGELVLVLILTLALIGMLASMGKVDQRNTDAAIPRPGPSLFYTVHQ